MPKRKAFLCEACGEAFPTQWSDEEAEAEYKKVFGEDPPIDRAIICEDCYQIALRLAGKSV